MFRKKAKTKKEINVIDYKIVIIDYKIVYSYSINEDLAKDFDRKETIDKSTGNIIVDLYNDNLIDVF